MNERFRKYKGRCVLITGGLGFIGSNLAHRLAETGEVEIRIVDSLQPDQGGNRFNLHGIENCVRLHLTDLSDDRVINDLVCGVDYVFNLAGSLSHLNSVLYPQRDLHNNCTAQLTLLEACRHFNPQAKIVYTSTRQVYGQHEYLPLDEKHRVVPPDINGIHKHTAEQYHELYHRLFGVRSTILRLTNTYGPRHLMRHNQQGFMGWFIRKAMDGEVIEIFGDGQQQRDLNYVEDVVDALLLAGADERADGETFNLGGAHPVSLLECTRELIALTGKGSVRLIPFPPERRAIDIGDVYSDWRKIEARLGWHPQTELREGLRRTIAFYEQHREHYWNADQLSQSQAKLRRA
jgi:UDP-glucose 4-epimerase